MQKFIALNNQKAMAMIHASLGDEALIYSTRTVAEGVEIIAGLPEGNGVPNEGMLSIMQSLQMQIGQIVSQVQEVTNLVKQPHFRAGRLKTQTIKNLLVHAAPALLLESKQLAFIGPSGVGKTTVIMKLATQLQQLYGPNCLSIITLDYNEIAETKRLTHFCSRHSIPLHYVGDRTEVTSVEKSCQDKRWVLIDFPGMNADQAGDLAEAVQLLSLAFPKIDYHVVLSACLDGKVIRKLLAAYTLARPKSCFLSHTDGLVDGTELIHAVIEAELPVSFISNNAFYAQQLLQADADHLINTMLCREAAPKTKGKTAKRRLTVMRTMNQ